MSSGDDPGVVVVGYGNVLRTDDGVGWHAAGLLATDPRFTDVTVLQRHQLTPELALDISSADLVVLIDADPALPPGAVVVTDAGTSTDEATAWTHHVGPAALAALAEDLYGRAADVVLVRCGVQSFDVGEYLSPTVASALPRVVEAVSEVVLSHSSR